MKLLQYSDLNPSGLKPQFDRTIALLEAGNFRGADVKKLAGSPFYRAKLSDADRLLFRFCAYRGDTYLVLLEIIHNHDYAASRFLRGASTDESKLVAVMTPAPAEAHDVLALNYVNPSVPRVHVLDKILSFDELQEDALRQRPPLILIGSAGSGKTVLTLEKLRHLPGEVLYVTLSPFLADNARTLYYSHHYENPVQEVAFLSFLEFMQTIALPAGKPLTFAEFAAWFARHRASSPVKDAHPVFEEFNGVLTGSAVTRPYLALEDYLNLGVRRSIFTGAERPAVYDLFRKYLAFLETSGCYDMNLACFNLHAQCRAAYDFVVADEVQDLTAVQLSLILQSLRRPDQFVLCGDANQIVHPNFFSWAGVKSFFYEQRLHGQSEIIRILNTNYRNSPEITALANRLLLIKNARFGSIDRESHYLVRPVSENAGCVEFLKDSVGMRRDIDAKTGRSARFAVLVMREEDKADARRSFRTPLVFSVQEAKGLEYENIILLNFVSSNARAFDVLAEGVSPADLQGDFAYARTRDKGDKSLEAHKFFVNALYVAITRCIRNLYILEQTPAHPLLGLLALGQSRDAAVLAAQQSSLDEWKEEARKLERQGKTEQVEAIRRSILHTEPVPWRVLTPGTVDELARAARDPAADQKTRRLLLDYAATYAVTPLIAELAATGFKPALRPEVARHEAQQRHGVDFHQRGYRDLRRKMDLHGVDFRNPLNQTPLMIATQFGLVPLVEQLVQDGAGTEHCDNWGRNPLQIALRAAYQNPLYAKNTLGALYPVLAPAAIKVRVGDRLVKIDSHRMEFFLLHSMLALFEFILRTKINTDVPAFETADFVHALAHFPESVIPLRRRRREAITQALAGNEVFRACPGNRGLFVRVGHGLYIPNPCMAFDLDGTWVGVRELLHFDLLERESENERLAYFLNMVRDVQAEVDKFLAQIVPQPVTLAPPALSNVTRMMAPASPPAPPEPQPAVSASHAVHHDNPDPASAKVAVTPVASDPAEKPLEVSATVEPAQPILTSSATQPTLPKLSPRLEARGFRLAKSLFAVGGAESIKALRWLESHPEEGAAISCAYLDMVVQNPDELYGCEIAFHALCMLAQFRTLRAYPLALRLAALPDAKALLADCPSSTLGRLLASVFDGDLVPLQELMLNRYASDWARASAVYAMAVLVLHDGVNRESVVRFLRQISDDSTGGLEHVPSDIWVAVADVAAALHPGELLDNLRRAGTRGLLRDSSGSLERCESRAGMTVAEVLQLGRTQLDGPVTNAIAEAMDRQVERTRFSQGDGHASQPKFDALILPAGMSGRPDQQQALPQSHPSEPAKAAGFDDKVGRNEPCPCGSGRKFKKCCGRSAG